MFAKPSVTTLFRLSIELRRDSQFEVAISSSSTDELDPCFGLFL